MGELSILFVSYLSTRPQSNTSFSNISLKQKGFHRNEGLLVPSATLFKPVIHPMKAFFLSCKLPLEAKSQTRDCWPKLSLEECLFCSWQLTVVTKCLCNSFVIWGLGAGPVICRVGYGQGLRGPGFNSGSLLPFIKRTCRPKICSVSVCSEKQVLQRISAHIFLWKISTRYY